MNKYVQPARKQLRQFGLMVGPILIAVGLWRLYKGDFETGRLVLWSAGGALLALGLLAPALLTPVYKGWMKLAHGLAYVNTRILITLIFYLVVTPIGLLMRMIKGDILAEKFDRNAPTYWNKIERSGSLKEHFERQF